jgi:ABC-2 type transport system ATP-binding protein
MIRGIGPAQIGDIARDHQVAIHELGVEQASLEEAFMKMTASAVEYHAVTYSEGRA